MNNESSKVQSELEVLEIRSMCRKNYFCKTVNLKEDALAYVLCKQWQKEMDNPLVSCLVGVLGLRVTWS